VEPNSNNQEENEKVEEVLKEEEAVITNDNTGDSKLEDSNNIENEEHKKNSKIEKKIGIRFFAFIICSLIYIFLITAGGKNRVMLNLDATFTVKIMQVVMIISYIISGLGLVLIFISIVFPKVFRANMEKIKYSTKNTFFNILDWGMILPICSVIATTCFCYLFIITPVDGTSMMPTIKDGERVFVSYIGKKDRFDVIVTEVNAEDNFNCSGTSRYIKRIIGLPGEEVLWQNSILSIKKAGESTFSVVDEPFLDEMYLPGVAFDGLFCYKENGVAKTSYVIPEGYYFVMGDNRRGSKDSREIGLVPMDNVIGIAKYHMGTFFSEGKIV
jgi:signal peptidase I